MKRILILAVMVGIVAAFGITGVVLAQNPDPTNPMPGWGGHMGRGMMGGTGYGLMHEYMQAALAEQLGISVDDLNAAYAEGKTFWQIAEEKGFTVEQTQQMMTDAHTTALDAMVADGTITQEQADQMKQHGDMMGGGRMGAGGCHGGTGTPGGMMRGGRR